MLCLLVDDEPLLLRKLERTLLEVLPMAQTKGFINPFEAIAFAETSKVDIAFLDIKMRGIDGLELAKRLVDIRKDTNIVFCTGFESYALEAFNAYASDYLMKPITVAQVERAISNLRHPIKKSKRVRFHCFGNFEAFCDNEPIPFNLTRTSELLAYLVDRDGAECRVGEMVAVLFEDEDNREYYKKLRQDLIQTFTRLDILDCLNITRGALAIKREMVDCDYFDYKDGKIGTTPNEYMSQYSFGEITLAGML